MTASTSISSPRSEMTSRERMLAAIRRQPVDRVPTDIWATWEVRARLRERFGDDATVRRELHIDGMGGAWPKYVGPKLPEMPKGESVDFWGNRFRSISHGTGAYDEQYFHALAQARTIDDLEAYDWPRADWFDFSAMREQAALAHQQQAVQCGYMATFYYHNMIRGLEQSLIDPLEDPDFTEHLLRKLGDYFYDLHRCMFESCDGLIDVSQVTDDLGTQTGPMISLDIFRRFYRPQMQRHIDLCHEFGILVMHHDDGGMSGFIPDLLDMGINLLNPIQWRCPGMDPAKLKRDFGDRLAFHGAIDNQETLPHGTTEDVRAEVRRMIDTLASDKTGYILAPCHNIQPVTPMENIDAMYDEAWRYGKF